jgi:hypothetical protein
MTSCRVSGRFNAITINLAVAIVKELAARMSTLMGYASPVLSIISERYLSCSLSRANNQLENIAGELLATRCPAGCNVSETDTHFYSTGTESPLFPCGLSKAAAQVNRHKAPLLPQSGDAKAKRGVGRRTTLTRPSIPLSRYRALPLRKNDTRPEEPQRSLR